MSNVIEQAAREYADVAKPYLLGEEMELVRNAFEAGAEWALANQWHSVADGDLPTKDGEYLVLVFGVADFFSYHVESNYWSKSRAFFYKDWCEQDRITHWMEIPQFNEKGGE